nr:hypothetical protein [Tanacetum cinerariifolium]
MPSFPSPEPTVSYFDDLDFVKDFENKFPAIVYNDALTSKSDSTTETVEIPHRIDEFDLKNETSLSEYKDNDDDKIDIKRSSRGNTGRYGIFVKRIQRIRLLQVSDSEDENATETKSKQRKPSFAKVELVKPNEQVKYPRESVKKEEHNRQAKHPRKNSQSPRDKDNKFNENVNIVKGNITIAVPRAVVSDNRGNQGSPQFKLQEKRVIDSGCSRHMTGNMSYLSEYEEIDGGYVAFGGDPKRGKITSKGKISTGELDFEDVYFVKELKFKLLSVSQMCAKKNSVLFTDTECVVSHLPHPDYKERFTMMGGTSFFPSGKNEMHRGPSFCQVLLRVPRKNNMYSVDLKNVSPSGGKFDGKADEGFFVGYSTNSKSKAFSVFNSRTRIVEENLHVCREDDKKDAKIQRIKITSLTDNVDGIKDNVVDKNIVYGCADDMNMPNLKEIVYSDDDDDGTEADCDTRENFKF